MTTGRRGAQRPGSVAGFSLLEVLTAMTVLAAGLITVTTGLRTCLDAIRSADVRERAVQTAQLHLDGTVATLRARGWEPGVTGDLGASDLAAIEPADAAAAFDPVEDDGFAVSTTVTPVIGARLDALVLCRIDVTVGWERAGRQGSLTLGTETLAPARDGGAAP